MRSTIVLFVAGAFLIAGCRGSTTGQGPSASSGSTIQEVMQARNLTPDDAIAALKTYMPSGRIDDYIMFASGGHSGQVFVIGVPSMRLIRSIAVFTPEPWQGWATDPAMRSSRQAHLIASS